VELAHATVLAPPPPRHGLSWWGAILSVLAGSIVSFFLLIPVWVVPSALRLAPTDHPAGAGAGWPWRIDGAWSLLADAGPLLACGFVVSTAIGWYVQQRTGEPPARWPLALALAVVGWLPMFQGGFLAVSGGGAFVVAVLGTRYCATRKRVRMPWTRGRVALAVTAGLLLAATSGSFGALHPLRVPGVAEGVALHHGRGAVGLPLENHALGGATVLRVSLVDTPGLVLARASTPNGRASAPTVAGLDRPLAGTSVPAGTDGRDVDLALRAPACGRTASGGSWDLRALDVRLRTLGIERTQRVWLDHPVRVRCGRR
jgi:hypothetical protein